MSRYRVPPPANDVGNAEGRAPEIRVKRLASPVLTDIEVEIFDALISTVEALTAANDNDAPLPKEDRP